MGRQEKEEIKKISKIELDELKRLHVILDQAPDRKIGIWNLRDEAMKNTVDYHQELAKKYNFNPRKVGINRHTGELQKLPEEKKKKENKKDE